MMGCHATELSLEAEVEKGFGEMISIWKRK